MQIDPDYIKGRIEKRFDMFFFSFSLKLGLNTKSNKIFDFPCCDFPLLG